MRGKDAAPILNHGELVTGTTRTVGSLDVRILILRRDGRARMNGDRLDANDSDALLFARL